MTSLLKTSIPYVMMIALMALTLWTRDSNQASTIDPRETADSLAKVAKTALEDVPDQTHRQPE
ncbi:MAG: hypothetical protein OER04_12090 [Cyclobacteriaceae bacterium]|nr:hypothetical protein [Cyclobacteriaceae bacterium]